MSPRLTKLFKNRSDPLVLGTKTLVQFQTKETNLFPSSTPVALTILTLPIKITASDVYKTNRCPFYVKTIVWYAFITSLIPMTIFIYSGQEIIISNWHWITYYHPTLKLSLSSKFDFFSVIFLPVAQIRHMVNHTVLNMLYTLRP